MPLARIAKPICLLLLGLSFLAQAQAQVRSEQAIAYRKAAFQIVVWNFSPMAAMVRGTVPYDKAKFALNAKRVAQMVPALVEGFPPGSDKGGNTEAKPEIWQSFADFQTKMKTFETESAALAKLSKGGDFEKIKVQFGKVGAACKACHDKYKLD